MSNVNQLANVAVYADGGAFMPTILTTSPIQFELIVTCIIEDSSIDLIAFFKFTFKGNRLFADPHLEIELRKFS